MNSGIFLTSVLISLAVLSTTTFAMDVDIMHVNKRHSEKDNRSIYPYKVLQRALEESSDTYGAFKIQPAPQLLPNNRTMELLVEGKHLTVAMLVTRQEWEDIAIPVRIPIRRGALAYRLLAIHQDNINKFKDINTLEELKTSVVGLHKNWSANILFRDLGFNVINAYSYEGLFKMLHGKRFDYIPRGVHEIYDELEQRKTEFPNLVPEPHIALYSPAPFYIFVTPKRPDIAKRIEYGLEKMIKSGELKSMFDEYYGGYFEQANLQDRTIIDIGNHLLPKGTPLERKELWVKFDVPKSGSSED